MSIDTATANSPGWWLRRLIAELGKRQRRYNRLDDYYRGECDLPEGAENAREAYRRFQRKARTNFAELLVEAVRERMVPVAFRSGDSGNDTIDKLAWRIWQANCLDADAALVHRSSLTMSDAYAIVGGPDEYLGGLPLITPEDPRQVITAQDPMRRRRVVAALKVFTDDVQELDLAYVYLPGYVFRASRRRAPSNKMFSFNMTGWDWIESDNPQKLPYPVVPVVRFPNRADLSGNVTLGEFETVIDVLDRINHTVLQRLVITALQAFRQRAIKGDLPEKDLDGNPIDYAGIFSADPGALWRLPAGVDLWESSQTDLTSILSGARHDIQDLAAISRTPLFYLTPDAASGSAEGASLAREGLTFKTADRIAQATESWEQTLALALLFSNENITSPPEIQVKWQAVDLASMAERYDAASKAGPAGLPWRNVMEDVLGFPPQEVDRMAAERTADALLFGPPIAAPATAAVTAPAPAAAGANAAGR